MQKAWIIINKKIRGPTAAAAAAALYNFIPICHLSRSRPRKHAHAAIRM